jgi:hypothetical protein
MKTTLIDLFREQLKLDEKLQAALDGIVTPAGRREESWMIAWVKDRDADFGIELEVALDPPDGALEWNYPTTERFQLLQQRLGCDRIYAVPVDTGEIRYVASYDHKTGT